MNRIRSRERAAGEGGFTLIELLVVIAILGILSAVVVFAVSGISDKGETSACKIDTRTLATANEAHFAQLGDYADEATLKANGFLSDESSYHEITNVVNPAGPTPLPSYDIEIAAGNDACGTPGNTVGETANDF